MLVSSARANKMDVVASVKKRARSWRYALVVLMIYYARGVLRTLALHKRHLDVVHGKQSRFKTALLACKYVAVAKPIALLDYFICFTRPRLAARIVLAIAWKAPPHVVRHVAYGGHHRHRLDLFGAGSTPSSKPVLLFVHGGAWAFGHKWQYTLIGEYLARQGFLVAVMSYRTYPHGSVDEMVQDIHNAVRKQRTPCFLNKNSINNMYLRFPSSSGASFEPRMCIIRRRREQNVHLWPLLGYCFA